MKREEIQALAHLARIKLSEEEEKAFANDFAAILSYVSEVQKGKEVSHTDAEGGLVNVFREDGEPHGRGAWSEKLLAEAPQRDGRLIRVKSILER